VVFFPAHGLDVTRSKLTSADLTRGVLRATHSLAGARERWAKLRRTGCSNDELRGALGFELGVYGGSSLPNGLFVSYRGVQPLEIAIGHSTNSPLLTIRGARLLAVVRRELDIQRPGGHQLSLL